MANTTTHFETISRKDKRRHNFESKVSKIAHSFAVDKDTHYRDRLTSLQTTLTTLHQGNSSQFLRQLRDLEEERDFELVRLRLFEEYRVNRSSIEFQEDIEKTKVEHEKIIKLCKEKLYESLETKVKNLQEERLLMDVANAHSYSMDYSRTKLQKATRSATAIAWDSSANEFGKEASANESATDTGTERRSLRRRLATTATSRAMSDEQDPISTKESPAPLNDPSESSDSMFLQGLSSSSELHTLLFGDKEREKKKTRGTNRLSTKAAPPLQSLKQEEVTEDIALIRSLSGQPPAPFKN
ncbi:LANO_0H06194g1_1 [Lachancea nothofagi CBS 11611]|uniref:LANO_0H06194g1_1 n=1 Tax=Lachancea nothofagi CBS 11611 TaxID=1266666 RepID=A0A1G4KLM2_9SACH|nr:LANO_0H06194g1_1 [Lachancea nothofagi CBS 11611]